MRQVWKHPYLHTGHWNRDVLCFHTSSNLHGWLLARWLLWCRTASLSFPCQQTPVCHNHTISASCPHEGKVLSQEQVLVIPDKPVSQPTRLRGDVCGIGWVWPWVTWTFLTPVPLHSINFFCFIYLFNFIFCFLLVCCLLSVLSLFSVFFFLCLL